MIIVELHSEAAFDRTFLPFSSSLKLFLRFADFCRDVVNMRVFMSLMALEIHVN